MKNWHIYLNKKSSWPNRLRRYVGIRGIHLPVFQVWQPSRPTRLSLAGLTLWLNWLERWLATPSVLSTQVRIPAGMLPKYEYHICWYAATKCHDTSSFRSYHSVTHNMIQKKRRNEVCIYTTCNISHHLVNNTQRIVKNISAYFGVVFCRRSMSDVGVR